MILFDEIEKAHQDVFNVLLQILEDGRLTDGQGRTVDFKNTVVIMTSNVGDALKSHFRPEFLNRIDEIIVFNSLSEENIKQIVDIQLRQLKKRLAERHLDIEVTDAAKSVLAHEGYDPTYGARPLKRAIQREIQDKLAMLLLEGKFKEGDRILVDADSEGKLTFEHAGTAASV